MSRRLKLIQKIKIIIAIHIIIVTVRTFMLNLTHVPNGPPKC